jgi:hypothetical protein
MKDEASLPEGPFKTGDEREIEVVITELLK